MRILWMTFLGSAAISMLSALFAEHFLEERRAIVDSFVGLHVTYNPGVAFGVHLPTPIQELLIGFALVLFLYIAYRTNHETYTQWALGLILGGGSANIVDRLWDGYVTDFLQVGIFPVFNVADSCITIGAAILFIQSALAYRRKHC